jgi:kynureninase
MLKLVGGREGEAQDRKLALECVDTTDSDDLLLELLAGTKQGDVAVVCLTHVNYKSGEPNI